MEVIEKIVDKLSVGARAIKSRWVYAKKYDAFGTLEKYKARIVAKGYLEKNGIDYDEIFSPTNCSFKFCTTYSCRKKMGIIPR